MLSQAMAVFFFILWTLSIALKLSILRWVELAFYRPSGLSWQDIGLTIFTGFRFDMMIIGFWLAPVVVYLIFSQLFTGKAIAKPIIVKTYLILSWLFICLLYLKDLVSFPALRERLWLPDHLEHPLLNFDHASQLEWWTWITITLLMLGLFKIGFNRFQTFTQKFEKIGYFSLAFIFLWTVLISRGTLTQHHLRRKDCQFSTNKKVEALCLNPIFTFSKNK